MRRLTTACTRPATARMSCARLKAPAVMRRRVEPALGAELLMKEVNRTKYLLILMGTCLLAWPPSFDTAALGQQPAPKSQPPRPDCAQPYAKLESSEWSGRVMRHALSAGLNGGSAKQGLTYKWEVSPGTITSGQGGPSLT